MPAAARRIAPRPSALEIVVGRAEARALLWEAGEFDLHEAIDVLWHPAEHTFAAVRDDLPNFGVAISKMPELASSKSVETSELSDTELDTSSSASTGASSCADWAPCRAADEKQRRKPPDPHIEKLRRLMADEVTLERAWHEINHPTDRAAASTVEAAVYALRTHGCPALATNRARLTELSDGQLHQVIVRVGRLRSQYPLITDELLELLAELLP